MVSVLYVVLSTALVIWLAFEAIKIRRAKKISLGDGGDKGLQAAMVAQTNALEYIPLALLLLFALEYNGAPILLVHLAGILLLAGRFIHAKAILADDLSKRVLGMKLTFLSLAAMCVLNLVFLPYAKFF